MNLVQVSKVIRAILHLITEGSLAQALHFGIVHISGQHDLSMPMKQGSTSPPQTIPDQGEIFGLGVAVMRFLGPAPGRIQIVNDLLLREKQRIVLPENDYPMKSIVLGDVAPSDTMLSFNPTENVLWRIPMWVLQRITLGSLDDLGGDIKLVLGFDRTGSSQPVE